MDFDFQGRFLTSNFRAGPRSVSVSAKSPDWILGFRIIKYLFGLWDKNFQFQPTARNNGPLAVIEKYEFGIVSFFIKELILKFFNVSLLAQKFLPAPKGLPKVRVCLNFG